MARRLRRSATLIAALALTTGCGGQDSGNKSYKVPGTNPFLRRRGARPEIWAFGLRNPWRFSFDRVTGDLWIGDVGQYILEEVDAISLRRSAGANFGWNRLEGHRRFIGSPHPRWCRPPTNMTTATADAR